MKSKRTFFSPVILFIYIATVLAFVISLFVEYKSSPAKIEKRVDELARATTQNLSVNQAGSEAFKTAFLHSIGPSSDIAGIQLSQGDFLIFSYPRDLAENSPTRSPFVTVTERSLYAQNQDAVQMKVASYLIEPSSLYTKGLITFFIILATTLFCVTYLIYLYASSEKKYYDSDYYDKEKTESNDRKNEEAPAFLEKNLSDEEYEPEISTNIMDPLDETDFPDEPDTLEKWDYPDETDKQDESVDSNEQQNYDGSEEIAGQEKQDKSEELEDTGFQMPQSPSSTITQEEFQALTQNLLDEPFAEEENTDENVFNDISIDEQELNDRAIKNEAMIENLLEEEEKSEDKSILPEMRPIHTNLDLPLNKPEKENNNLSLASEEPKVIKADDNTHPAGLFSPRTGFGWEDYMIPRLDSELIRAASGDQDLTVMTIEISKINWESEEAKEICELILDLVKFKDLVFEYGKSGCTAIIQNMGIEEALKAAEDLHTNIIASMARRKLYYIVSIGLSARSLRLISGTRIAKESEQALIHAMEDKSTPVVAFKVNPERYRNYIATESAKLDKRDTQLSVTSS